jgi:hypothetical protein
MCDGYTVEQALNYLANTIFVEDDFFDTDLAWEKLLVWGNMDMTLPSE